MENIISNSLSDTEKIAHKLAKILRGASIITLEGDLGAGKTTFSKALASALGVTETVNSPTFAIMKVHRIVDLSRPTIKNFLHIDAYRLKDFSEFVNLGVEDYLGQDDTISVIEWPSRIDFPAEQASINIHIRHISENQREFRIEKNAP